MPGNTEFDSQIEEIEEEEEQPREADPTPSLNPKLVFGSLLFFGLFTLAFGSLKIWKDIRSPALVQEQTRASADVLSSLAAPAALTDEELKRTDSDGDGLMDWDELNRFGTSPYLKDSDADSYPDKVEIDTNNDPNCPRGQQCRIGSGTSPPAFAGGVFSDLAPTPPPGAAGVPPPDLANLTPQQLRDLLLQTGEVTKEQLDQVDDATLMQMYLETLSQQQGQQPPQP